MTINYSIIMCAHPRFVETLFSKVSMMTSNCYINYILIIRSLKVTVESIMTITYYILVLLKRYILLVTNSVTISN